MEETDNGCLVKQVENELHRFSGGVRFICDWLENQVSELIRRLSFREINSASVLDRDTIAEILSKVKYYNAIYFMFFKYVTLLGGKMNWSVAQNDLSDSASEFEMTLTKQESMASTRRF